MSNFERIYQIDPSREANHPREKHPSIELSDADYYATLQPKVRKDMEEAGFVYKPPVEEESMSPALKEKFKKARKICEDTKTITQIGPPPIPMKLDMPELEKAIREGKKNERKKNKAPAKRTKKANSQSDQPAVASLQA